MLPASSGETTQLATKPRAQLLAAVLVLRLDRQQLLALRFTPREHAVEFFCAFVDVSGSLLSTFEGNAELHLALAQLRQLLA